MKNIYSGISSLITIFLLAFLITGCGKKDSASESGATDSKKESTKQESKTEDSKTESTPSGNTNSNTDAMIDEYQEIMDEYVSIIKEVKGGNMSEMKKMQELSVKASTWASKLAEIAPELTEAQKKRIEKISEEAGGMMKY